MAAEIEFQDKSINKFFESLRGKLSQINDGQKKFVAILSDIVYGDIIDHFVKEEGSQGKWQHWSFWYELQMMRQKTSGKKSRGKKILQFSGKLRNNFKPTKYHVKNGEISWFNDATTKGGFPYAFAHNEGGPILPKRDFMWASDGAIERMAQNTLGFILDEGV